MRIQMLQHQICTLCRQNNLEITLCSQISKSFPATCTQNKMPIYTNWNKLIFAWPPSTFKEIPNIILLLWSGWHIKLSHSQGRYQGKKMHLSWCIVF
jgi:hypothetical protein